MGRPPVANRATDGVLNKGPWTEEEDAILTAFVKANGEGNWRTLPKLAGLQRCRKSCRLRWMNYLRPDLKRGNFSPDEDELIVKLHSLLGNRWSLIAGRIPGRTDNEIKNYWNSRLRRKLNSTGTQGERIEATPLSFNEVVASSSNTIEALANHPGDSSSFPEYAEGLAGSSGSLAYGLQDLPANTFPEYARFHMTSNEATPSEPCSSDGIDDCSDHAGYYSTWTPSSLDEVANADSVKYESSSSGYAYSPESVLPQLDSADDFLFSDFISFTNGLADLGETTFQKLLHSMPLSPLHKNLVSMPWPAFYSGDSF